MFCSTAYTQNYTTVTVSTQEVTCAGGLGSITLSPILSGTYTYTWSTGDTTASIDSLPMGKYSCTVTVDSSAPEVVRASTFRSWELGRLVPNDTSLSMVGNTATANPNLPSQNHADQRLHVYDKTAIDIENDTGRIFARFTNNHPNFPNQSYDSTKPPVFYIELLEENALDARELHKSFVFHAALGLLVSDRKIYAAQERQVFGGHNYTGHDYNTEEELEIRFLGNHQLEVYLEGTLIHSATLPQKASNHYLIAVGFNDNSTLDRRVAYDLKSSFCSERPLVKQTINHASKYSLDGSIDVELIAPSYLSGSYNYLWNTGATTSQLSSLGKGAYSLSITNTTSNTTSVINSSVEEKMHLEANIPATTIAVFSGNSITIEPTLPRPTTSIADYRSYGYDERLVVEANPSQPQSIKWWVSGDHSTFPNQQYNTELINAVFYVGLHPVKQAFISNTNFENLPFKLFVPTDGKMYLIDRVGGWAASDQVASNLRHHREGMAMEWRFVGNRTVEFYLNDLLVATKTLPAGAEQYYWTAGFNEKSERQRRIIHDVRTSFDSKEPPNYALLKNKPEAGYVQLTDSTLFFKFVQQYAVQTGESVDYTIYDWQRTPIQQGSFDIDYGTNWKALDLIPTGGTNYNNQEIYSIEFKANKEEFYTMRFKIP
jgi:hypothetical protein